MTIDPTKKQLPQVIDAVAALEKRLTNLECALENVLNTSAMLSSGPVATPTPKPTPKPLPEWAAGYKKPDGPRVRKITDKLYAIDGFTKLTENLTDEDWALIESELGVQTGEETNLEEGSENGGEDTQASN